MYAPNINITNQYFMSLMIVLKKSQGITPVIGIHLPGNKNYYTEALHTHHP